MQLNYFDDFHNCDFLIQVNVKGITIDDVNDFMLRQECEVEWDLEYWEPIDNDGGSVTGIVDLPEWIADSLENDIKREIMFKYNQGMIY